MKFLSNLFDTVIYDQGLIYSLLTFTTCLLWRLNKKINKLLEKSREENVKYVHLAKMDYPRKTEPSKSQEISMIPKKRPGRPKKVKEKTT